jgi:hypothetical protein
MHVQVQGYLTDSVNIPPYPTIEILHVREDSWIVRSTGGLVDRAIAGTEAPLARDHGAPPPRGTCGLLQGLLEIKDTHRP